MNADPTEPAVEVFTQEYCPSCRQVEALLTEHGVAFQSRDVLNDADALEAIAARGYMSTPITRFGDTGVAGFDREQLLRLIGETP